MIYLHLYLIVLKITLMSFGGAYSIWALIDRELVMACDPGVVIPKPIMDALEIPPDFRICRNEFNAIFGVGEVLPGPQINAIAILAFRQLGLPGMLVMILAFVSPGLLWISFFGSLQHRLKSSILLGKFFSGAVMSTVAILSAFSINLILGLVSKMDFRSMICSFIIAAAFWASFCFRLNPLMIVGIAALVGYSLL